jgi:hypothetical protein
VSGQQNHRDNDERYWTPHHMRIAVTPTGVVLLNLKHDRYIALDEEDARDLAALASNWSEVSSMAQPFVPLSLRKALARVEALIRAGLLTAEPQDVTFRTTSVDLTVQLTSVGLQADVATSVRFHHISNFVRACLWSKKAMRSRSLYSVACELSATKASAETSISAADVQRTTELVCIFRRLRPYAFESKDRCLFHALALLHFLGRYGSYPTWVIGVCARPWAAHSWLQLDNCLLDSSPDDVSIFTPILAV